MKTITLLVALAAMSLSMPALIGPALAQQTETTTRTATVSTAGLDLSKPAHVAEFDRRLERTLSKVCRPRDTTLSGGQTAARQCRDAARIAAVGQRDQVIAAAEQTATMTASR